MGTENDFQDFGERKTPLRFTAGIAEALERHGVDSRDLFARAGIPFVSAAEQATLIDLDQSNRLYKLAVQATGDPGFGLKVAQCIPPTTFKVAGYSLYASNNLHEFCKGLVRFFGSLNVDARHNFDASYSADDTRGIYQLSLAVTERDLCFESVDTWVGYLVKVCREISGPGFSPKSIELIRPVPQGSEQEYQLYFRAPVRFSAQQNAIFFDRGDIYSPALTTNIELASQLDDMSTAYLTGIGRNNIARRVTWNIGKLLPTGNCSRQKVAAALNLSERSLNSKLKECGTSYQEILEELRLDSAKKYLSRKHLSLAQIGYQLGFSDSSSFARAFRRWTGLSPSEYRNQL